MEERSNLKPPVGAIWVRGTKLKNNVQQAFEKILKRHNIYLSANEIDEFLSNAIAPHTLSVKLNTYMDETTGKREKMKEKFIAIENRSKKTDTQPDYFLHTYQTHTGAAPEYPWGTPGTQSQKVPIEDIGAHDTVRKTGGEQPETPRMEL